MSTTNLDPTQETLQPDFHPREIIFDGFRRWGHLQARLDPLGQYLRPVSIPELRVTGEYADEARRYYCGSIGAEFMHIPDARRREWIQARLETDPPAVDQKTVLEQLVPVD